MDTIPERLWSAAETSAFLGVPVATLHQWRYLGTGPKAYRVGRWLRTGVPEAGSADGPTVTP